MKLRACDGCDAKRDAVDGIVPRTVTHRLVNILIFNVTRERVGLRQGL